MVTFTGGMEDDTFVGGIDADEASGNGGNDILIGLGGRDTLDGGAGDDALNGGDDTDILTGGSGSDELSGGSWDDWLYSDVDPGPYRTPYPSNESTLPIFDHGTEVDRLNGGSGKDLLSAGYGDFVNGGADADALLISFLAAPSGISADFRLAEGNGSITVGGATISSIEGIVWLEGSNFDDFIVDTSANGTWLGALFGMGGNDQIVAGYYTGEVRGGDGNDVLDLSGSQYVFGGYGEGGDDIIIGGNSAPTLDGGDGNDQITGGVNWDRIHGGSGDDTIDGGSVGDTIAGDAGNDILYGGADADTIDGGDGNDTIFGDESPDPSGHGSFPISDADILRGGAGLDTIHGDAGNDVIEGGADADLLYGDAGDDSVRGGTGDDRLELGIGDDSGYGGDGNDLILSGLGVDQLSGEGGDDRLFFGATFAAADLAAGGEGNDQLILQGDYAAGIALLAGNAAQIETVRLLSAADASYQPAQSGGSFSYNVSIADAVTSAGAALAIDTAGLSATETLTLDASADTNSRFTVTGGAGSDDLTGGAGGDIFFLQRGGNDRAVGGGGGDGFFFGGALTVADSVDGGSGLDSIALQGDYAAGLSLVGIENVEFLSLLSGANTQFGEQGTSRYSYNLATTEANVVAGATMTIQATGLLASEDLIFTGAAESNGAFRIFAGQGEDILTGGANSDGFFFGADGNLTAADRIDGGAGTDSIALRGNYALTLADATFANVEVLAFLSGHTNEYGGALVPSGYDYDVTLADGNLALGQTLDVNGSGLRANESLRFDGRAETSGSFRILSGAGDDILFGGMGDDALYGGLGKDALQGGAGADTYQYRSAAESTSTGYDAITGFDWQFDRIDAPGGGTRGFSQSAQGSLSTASFDADLAAGLNGLLGAGQAALFTANAGTLAGHIFAVIDVNGQAGYQAGQDLVIELVNSVLPIDPAANVII